MANYPATFTYQSSEGQVSGDNAGTEPALGATLTATFTIPTGVTLTASTSHLKFFVNDGTAPSSWDYTVGAGDVTGQTFSKAFTLSYVLETKYGTTAPDFTAGGRVYVGADWGF